jgi:hypothetical protein
MAKNKNMIHRKSGIVHEIAGHSNNYYTSLCGTAWGSDFSYIITAHEVTYYTATAREVTCKRCLHQIAKREGTLRRAKRKNKMSGQPVRLYTWPASQICSECANGALVAIGNPFEEPVDSVSIVCMENCGDNDGVNCNMYNNK